MAEVNKELRDLEIFEIEVLELSFRFSWVIIRFENRKLFRS